MFRRIFLRPPLALGFLIYDEQKEKHQALLRASDPYYHLVPEALLQTLLLLEYLLRVCPIVPKILRLFRHARWHQCCP